MSGDEIFKISPDSTLRASFKIFCFENAQTLSKCTYISGLSALIDTLFNDCMANCSLCVNSILYKTERDCFNLTINLS